MTLFKAFEVLEREGKNDKKIYHVSEIFHAHGAACYSQVQVY